MSNLHAFRRLLCGGAVAALLATAAPAQQQPASQSQPPQPFQGQAPPRLAESMGQAVLQAVYQFEKTTGKPAQTIIIHVGGKIPNPADQQKPNTKIEPFSLHVEVLPAGDAKASADKPSTK